MIGEENANDSDLRTISRVIDAGHGYLVKLTSGEQEVETSVGMGICNNHECQCSEVSLFMAPTAGAEWAEPLPEITAVIDINSGDILELHESCTPAFRRTLKELLAASLLDYLRERRRRVKLQHDPDAWRKQDWSWWEPGMLICWQDAFPGDYDDVVEVGEHRYAVDDHYCCAPECACDEVVLGFVDLGITEPTDSPPTITVTLSKWRATHEDSPLRGERLALWRGYSAITGAKARLVKRRNKLRAIGRELYRRAAATETVQPPVNVRTDKVGRNAPCPCGSGKKYKKCCGSAGKRSEIAQQISAI